MTGYNEIFDMAMGAFRKIMYPEEWIKLDMQLSKSELFTLLQVDRNGEIIMSRIADYINVPMSTATGLIERLVKKGFIERLRNETDRRIVAIRLTEKGKELTGHVKEGILDVIKTVMEALSDEERELLFGIFTKLSGIFSGNSGETGDKDDKKESSALKRIEIE